MNAWCVPEENRKVLQSFSPGKNKNDPKETRNVADALRSQQELEEIARQELLDLDNE
jgi:hypothetical protein